MYLTDKLLEAAAERWGTPRRLAVAVEISTRERDTVRGSRKRDRSHDVTFFIERGGRYAVIQKPNFPQAAWRAPSGGLEPGEGLQTGLLREALEETGLRVEIERYLVHLDATFTAGSEIEPWHTEVFLCSTQDEVIVPVDTHEISAARWATREEIQGPIRAALLERGTGLFRYRTLLTDATFEEIDRLRAG